MHVVLIILAVLLGVVGIIGSVVPGLPGPPVSWIGILIMYFLKGTNGAGEPMSLALLLILLGVTILVTVVDYLVPAWFTKFTGGSKHAGRGAIAGLILGLVYPPVGIVLGALLGAFLAELFFAEKDGWDSAKSAVGAFLGFVFGTGLKLIVSGLMLYYTIIFL